ncbi:MAG: heme ABC transporter ATP-binding protein [Pseudomonadota bacterium]
MSALAVSGLGIAVGETWLLRDVDISVSPGELVIVLGPNGAGKSTLLHALAGDSTPSEGRVELGGQRVSDMSLAELARDRAVVTPPKPVAFDYSVRDIVGLGWQGGPSGDAREREEALSRIMVTVEIEHLADRVYRTLSSGEKQRVQFARALLQVHRPEGTADVRYLLLDEPTANLDVRHAIALLDSLRTLSEQRVGILAIVHDLDLGARFADRIVLLAGGRVVASGTPETVMTAERLTRVYGTPVHVEHNETLGRLTVLT